MITRSGIHAIRALTALASQKPGEYVAVATIAEAANAPRNYLGKLLFVLARRGLVESQKGVSGGFRLSRRPDQISLYDVVSVIEDIERWKECAFGGSTCSDDSPCPIHARWLPVRNAYFSLLKSTTIAEVAASEASIEGSVVMPVFLQAKAQRSLS